MYCGWMLVLPVRVLQNVGVDRRPTALTCNLKSKRSLPRPKVLSTPHLAISSKQHGSYRNPMWDDAAH